MGDELLQVDGLDVRLQGVDVVNGLLLGTPGDAGPGYAGPDDAGPGQAGTGRRSAEKTGRRRVVEGSECRGRGEIQHAFRSEG